jgi:RHS repeat-associated protein
LGPVGNRQSVTEGTGRTLNWSYDGIYRLTGESISSDPADVNGTVAYGLDPVGNRQSETSTLSGLDPGSFTYNVDDELTTNSYDNNGNTTQSGVNSFTYDSENELKTMNGGAVTLLYDGDGNRVAETASGLTTQYLVDDQNPTGYAQVMEEVVGGAVTRRYTYGLQRISENQIVSNVWTPSFYGYDGEGSVRQLTSTAGAVTDTYEYDAFGNKVNSTGSTPNNYLYRGEQYDPDLSLYYLRARYYSPLTGRFLSVDPEAGEGQRRYEYADADPVNGEDPSGDEDLLEYRPLAPIPLMWVPSWCDIVKSSPFAKYFPSCGGSGGPGSPPPPPPPCRNGLKSLVLGDPASYVGRPVYGSGTCVDLLKDTLGNYPTKTWVKGGAPDATTPIGTFVATFFGNGGTTYNNNPGQAHVGAFDGLAKDGIWLVDQYKGVPRNQIEHKDYRRGAKRNYVADANHYFIVLVPCKKGKGN